MLQGVDATDAAESLARRKLASMTPLSSQQAARRIVGDLARRGFEPEIIEEVLNRLRLDSDQATS